MDFTKICRVCLKEGQSEDMMYIFKVNVSKKMMSCASIQVWQNDGLPAQICNKCLANLHVAFQFKKLGEKSDAKLRQYLLDKTTKKKSEEVELQKVNTSESQVPQPIEFSTGENTCVYIECTPLLETQHNEQKFNNQFVPVDQSLTQVNYNVQTHDPIQETYNIQGVEQVQIYNQSYSAIPLQQMQPLNNQPLQMQTDIGTLQPLIQQASVPPVPVKNVVKEEEKKKEKETESKKKEENKSDKQCSICNKIFATKTKMSRHKKTHAANQPYKCSVCSKQFSHGGNYKIHLRMHTGERPYRCTICDRACRQAQDLEKHMRTHTGERPHKCNMCPRAFSTSSNLAAHKRTHTGEKPYVCCVCQKAFCQSNELTKHMRTHTGEKSHICNICHRGFNGSSTLIIHKRSHTGERPYACTICGKCFSQSSCLSNHLKKHKTTTEKSHICSFCSNAFLTSEELEQHLLEHRSPVEQLDKSVFRCNICHEDFMNANFFNKHIKSHMDLEES